MSRFKITTDLFVIPWQDNVSVLYAPLKGFACRANTDLIAFLGRIEEMADDKLDRQERTIVELFVRKGIINGTVDERNDLSKPLDRELKPEKLTLFPTNGCNLRCIYCYAGAGQRKQLVMPKDTVISAVDYFIRYLKQNGKADFLLELHGGGEPFYDWNLVRFIIGYAQTQAATNGLQLSAYAATNGILNKTQAQWITDNFCSLCVSFDGLPRVQNYQRPYPNGSGSFEAVHQTLRFFDEANFPYGIRCTISQYNQNYLDKMIDFILENYRTKLIFVEPVNICGCCQPEISVLKPNLPRFVEQFKRLEPYCADAGVRLAYSGALFEKISPNFCYVGTDEFAITPDGYLTNCWEVTDKTHPLASTFIFGKIMPGGKLEIDNEKLAELRAFSVFEIDYCRDCFAKWHCAGDCVTRLGHNNYKGNRGGERCQTNREIIAYRITQMLERENYYAANGE